MAGDRIQATLQLRREVAEAGETLGSDHGNNACIQKHSLCDWGSTEVLGLKGGPLLPPPHILEEVDSSATERERIWSLRVLLSIKAQRLGWVYTGGGVMQVSTEGDSISNTSCWRPQGRGAALPSLGLPRTHNLNAKPQLLRKGRPDVGAREGITAHVYMEVGMEVLGTLGAGSWVHLS